MNSYELGLLLFYSSAAIVGFLGAAICCVCCASRLRRKERSAAVFFAAGAACCLSFWYVYAWETAGEVEMHARRASGTWHDHETYFSGEIVESKPGDP